jgi:hypothetical protein
VISKRLAALAAASVVVVSLGAYAAIAAADSPDSATVQITSVQWGGNSFAPTVTITGTGFGKKAPTGAPASEAPGCTGVTGSDYGTSIWFIDNTPNWRAGTGKPPTSGACVGLIISNWSNTSITLTFGSQYGSFNFLANQGDNFVWTVKGYPYGGLVSYP